MKIKSYIWVYLTIAIVIAILAISVIRLQLRVPDIISDINIEEVIAPEYGESHYNILIVDTFIDLNKQAYGELINIEKNHFELTVTLQNTNKLGSDYYNNNENLQKLKLLENVFEVVNDEKNNIIIAKFAIYKSNFVNVPNDVLISLMYKIYNK